MPFAAYRDRPMCFLLKEKEGFKKKPWDALSCLPPPYIPQTGEQEEQRATKEPEETGTKDCGGAQPTAPYPNLRKELEQCRKDIENFPIPSKQPMFPLPELPRGQGETGFVNAPFKVQRLGILRKR